MTKIALIGATGFVGAAILKEAAARGDQVTALVRHPEKVERLANVTAVKADVFDTDALASQLAGHDIVISAYNPGWSDNNIRENHINGSRSITKATKKAGIKRLIAVGGAGSLSINGKQLVDSPEFPAEWKEGALCPSGTRRIAPGGCTGMDFRVAGDHSPAGRTHRQISPRNR